jgi:MOSC domain-containing protein YiiM
MEDEQMSTVSSIQVGLPADHGADAISKKDWRSGIFKQPVSGRVWLDTLNLAGDGQEDLDNHGGPNRAILTYGADHYPGWRAELNVALPYGSFGENLTVTELTESTVCLGDVYALGEAIVQVTQPRAPCWKLARRNGIKTLTALVEQRGNGGWYQRVIQTGYVQAGDSYTLVERSYPQFTITLLNDLLTGRQFDAALLTTLSQNSVLTPGWAQYFGQMAQQ